MSQESLPIFYFPTTILFVDDDPMIIRTLKNTLDLDFTLKIYYDPHDIVEYFGKYQSILQAQSFIHQLKHEYEDTINHLPVDLDIMNIFKLSTIKKLKSEVSILVSDYAMPGLNGLELCQKIDNPFIKKILLTSSKDYEMAIDALNDKQIDCYLNKDADSTPHKLVMHIKQLSTQFFNEITKNLQQYLEVNHKLPISDPAFISFFNGIIEEHQIKEYYLIDKNGSFLLINEDKEEMVLAVHTDKSLNQLTDDYMDDKLTMKHIKAITARDKIPFFGIGLNAYDVAPSDWRHHLHTPGIINGKSRYYHCLVKI